MNTCYIVGALEEGFIPFSYDESDFIIACDKGYKYLKENDYRIDLIVGDFDSLGFIPEGNNKVQLPVIKDITDLHKSIEEGISRGYKEYKIYGCIGGRLEHTIASIQEGHYYVKQGLSITMYSEDRKLVFLYNSSFEVEEERGFLNVFSLEEVSRGITLKNLKYELCNTELKNTFPLGVSNEFINKKATIEVLDGCLLIIY